MKFFLWNILEYNSCKMLLYLMYFFYNLGSFLCQKQMIKAWKRVNVILYKAFETGIAFPRAKMYSRFPIFFAVEMMKSDIILSYIRMES